MRRASLYIHIPFCVRKCEYCDFYSGVAGDADIARYLDALDAEFALRFPGGFAPGTVFVGGGTPTRLSPGQLEHLGKIIKRRVDLARCREFTTEINPGTLTPAKADALAAMGVTRASFGVQSFSERFLHDLGRAYEAGTAASAVGMARAAGIDRVSMDLMFALPGQSLAELRDDLGKAVAHGTEHLSLYALTYEDDTPLTRQLQRGEVKPCPEELEREMFFVAGETCAAHGLRRYEVSNFARPGAECLHNLQYWRLGEWAGVGAGAHGLMDSTITANAADYKAYTRALLNDARLPLTRNERLSPPQLGETLLLMGLRLKDGVELKRFRRLTGADMLTVCRTPVEELVELGLIDLTETHVRATEEGLYVLDEVIVKLSAALEVPA